MADYPKIELWRDSKKAKRGPNELQIMYFIDRVRPEDRPHLHTQDVLLSIGGQGSGKCVPRDTLIVSFSGLLIPIQDIKIGDLLMGPDSKPKKVLGLGRGKEVFYKVIPNKGETWRCNESHILSLKMTNIGEESRINKDGVLYIKPPRYKGEKIINVSIKEYLSWSKKRKSLYKLYRSGCIEFPNPQELSIDPYILGSWLGDGTKTALEITNIDPEIINYWLNYANKLEKSVSITKNSKSEACRYLIKGTTDLLRQYNLLSNKHIPQIFKTASRESRLQLLAGFIDTDGNLCRNGFTVTQKSESLIQDLAFIVRSLGMGGFIKKKKFSYISKGTKLYSDCFVLTISCQNPEEVPTKVPRKQAKPSVKKRDVLVTGFTLEKEEKEDDYYGVVLGGDHLFLLGDFTVTHNTYGAVARIIDQCRLWPGLACYIGAYNMKVLARNVFKPFNEIMLPKGERHPFLVKNFSEQSPSAKFANGSFAECINLKDNLKQNIGFTAGFLLVDELKLLPDEQSLNMLIGRTRGIPPEIRQVILCTNPEESKEGWINQTFSLHLFDGVDTSEHPVQKLVGPTCKCQFCTKCKMTYKKEVEWVQGFVADPINGDRICTPDPAGDNMFCPNCKCTKDFYTWKGQRYWCPGDQQYWRVIKSESQHNPHCPDDYFQGMEGMYDEVFYDIMVKGALNTNLKEGYAYAKYSKEVNVLEDEVLIDYTKDFYWTMDHNLSPMCSSIHQLDDEVIEIEDKKVTKEIIICKKSMVMYGPTYEYPYGGCHPLDMAKQFVKDHKDNYMGTTIYMYGDPKGFDGQTERELTKYEKMRKYLEAEGFNVVLIADKIQIPRKERLDNTNHVLEEGILKINPSCVHEIKSFDGLKIKEGSLKYELDKTGDDNAARSVNRSRVYCMTHPTDAIGYMVYKLFPILTVNGVRSAHMSNGTIVQENLKGEVAITNSHQEQPKSFIVGSSTKPSNSAQAINDEYRRLEQQVADDIKRIENQSLRGLLGGLF